MRTVLAGAWLLLVVASMPERAAAQSSFRIEGDAPIPTRYATGGQLKLGPEQQAILDRNAGIVGLGLNTDWLTSSFIAPVPYLKAVEKTTDAVRAGRIPGAVLYANRFGGEVFPLPIGYLMTDPMKVYAQYATVYELGELSGAITAVPLALRAIERGELRLDQRLGDLLPEVSGGGKASITVEDLLRHRTGLPARALPPAPLRSREDGLHFLNAMTPMEPAPGESKVSRYNYLLLGLIVEKLAATPFQDLAEAEILRPLGMVNSTYSLPAAWRQITAPGPYCDQLGRLVWGESSDDLTRSLGRSAASGGLVSTADDLAIWAAAMCSPGEGRSAFLKPETIALMVAPPTSGPRDRGAGLGFRLGRFGRGSWGLDAAEGSSLWVLPQRGAFVILLSNAEHPKRTPGADPREAILGALDAAILPVFPREALTRREAERTLPRSAPPAPTGP